MEQNFTNLNAWYQKTWLVVVLCIVFFPVGLYALWKNSSIAKGWKVAVTVFIALLVIAKIGENSKPAAQGKAEEPAQAATATKTEEAKPDVEILKQTATYQETMDSYTIHCRVRNNTDELISYVDLKATFYDKQDKIVGTGIGNAANFAAGAEKTIDVMGLDIQNCDHYEVEVDNVIN